MGVTFSWLGLGGCVLFLAVCGWVWMSVTFFGWVMVGVDECDLFLGWVWLGMGECDLFLAGCGWVWVSVTFFLARYGWVWVGVSKCGWLWMSAQFINAQICMLHNFDTHHHLFLGSINNS